MPLSFLRFFKLGLWLGYVWVLAGGLFGSFAVAQNQAASYETLIQRSFDLPLRGGGGVGLELAKLRLHQADRSQWHQVKLNTTFQNPIVIFGPLTANDKEPAVIRIKELKPNSFSFQISEWDYLDGIHGEEQVAFLVIEAGVYQLESGMQLEAKVLEASSTIKGQRFEQTFDKAPAVIGQVQSYNNPFALINRFSLLSKASISFQLQREEALNTQPFAPEMLGYLALSRESFAAKEGFFTAGFTAEEVTHVDTPITLELSQQAVLHTGSSYSLVFANLLTVNGLDPTQVRYKESSLSRFVVYAEEELSADAEVGHGGERLGYLNVILAEPLMTSLQKRLQKILSEVNRGWWLRLTGIIAIFSLVFLFIAKDLRDIAKSGMLNFPGFLALLLLILASVPDLAHFITSKTPNVALAHYFYVNFMIYLLLFWLLFHLFRQPKASLRHLLANPLNFFLLFALVALLSAWLLSPKEAWTPDGWNVHFALRLLILFGSAGILAMRFKEEASEPLSLKTYLHKFIFVMMLFFTLRLLLMWVFALLNPETGFMSEESALIHWRFNLRLITWGAMNPNGSSLLSAMLFAAGLNHLLAVFSHQATQTKSLWKFWSLIMLLSLATIIINQSRTAFLVLGLSVFAVLFVRRYYSALVVGLIVLASLFLLDTPLAVYFNRGQPITDINDLGERMTVLWPAAIEAIKHSPYLGYGYPSGETETINALGKIIQGRFSQFQEVHNTFFSVLVTTGLLGFIPFFLGFILLAVKVVRRIWLLAKDDRYLASNLFILLIATTMAHSP
ncbi:MAG: O-antigen ligase family protein [Deinococcales bacterium]